MRHVQELEQEMRNIVGFSEPIGGNNHIVNIGMINILLGLVCLCASHGISKSFS